jgi:RHS repeat-associated protein
MLASFTQTFSNAGHIQTVTELAGRNVDYAYDLLYRLTNETIAGDPTAANNGTLAYGLDPVANRKTLTSTLAARPSQSFAYDADDRLSSDNYDANGNTLSSGGLTFTYDFEDRLLSTSAGVQIVYNGDGDRAGETAAGATIGFLVDEMTPMGYPQVAEEVQSGTASVQFVYGQMRISQNRMGTLSFYSYDAGGSTRELLSPAAAVTDTYSYDAFGNVVVRTGGTVNQYLYRGEQFDAALGMYYLRARYYFPQTGRFLTQDIDNGLDLRPSSLHKYVYAEGDPVGNTDHSGRNVDTAILFRFRRSWPLCRLAWRLRLTCACWGILGLH